MGKIKLALPKRSSEDEVEIKKLKDVQERNFELYSQNLAMIIQSYTSEQLDKAIDYFTSYAKSETGKGNPSADELKTTLSGQIANYIKNIKLASMYVKDNPETITSASGSSFITIYNTANIIKDGQEISLKEALDEFCNTHGYSKLSDSGCKTVAKLAQDCQNIVQEANILNQQTVIYDTASEVVNLSKDIANLQKEENTLYTKAAELGIDGPDMAAKKDALAQKVNTLNQQIEAFKASEDEFKRQYQEYDQKLQKSIDDQEQMKQSRKEYETNLQNYKQTFAVQYKDYEDYYKYVKERVQANAVTREQLQKDIDADDALVKKIQTVNSSVIKTKTLIDEIETSEAFKQFSKEKKPVETLQAQIKTAIDLTSAVKVGSKQQKIFQQVLDLTREIYKSKLYIDPQKDKFLADFNKAVKDVKSEVERELKEGRISADHGYYERWIVGIDRKTGFTHKLSNIYEDCRDLIVEQGKKYGDMPKLYEKYKKDLKGYEFDAESLSKKERLSPEDKTIKKFSLSNLLVNDKKMEEELKTKGAKLGSICGVKDVKTVLHPSKFHQEYEKTYESLEAKKPVSEKDLEDIQKECEKYKLLRDGRTPDAFDRELFKLQMKHDSAKTTLNSSNLVYDQLKQCHEKHNQYADKQAELLAREDFKKVIPNQDEITKNLKWFHDHYTNAQKSADYQNSVAFNEMIEEVNSAYQLIIGQKPNENGDGFEKLTAAGLAQAMEKVQNKAQAYYDAKMEQTRIIPSDQRKFRLRYADDLINFSRNTKKQMTEDLTRISGTEVMEKFINNKQTCIPIADEGDYLGSVQHRIEKSGQILHKDDAVNIEATIKQDEKQKNLSDGQAATFS